MFKNYDLPGFTRWHKTSCSTCGGGDKICNGTGAYIGGGGNLRILSSVVTVGCISALKERAVLVEW